MSHKFQHDIIFTALPIGKENAVTVKELFESLDPADQGRFGSSAELSKTINNMREKKLKGKIANGNSEIVGGQTRLTWYKLEEPHATSTPVSKSVPNERAAQNAPLQMVEETQHQQPDHAAMEKENNERIESEESPDKTPFLLQNQALSPYCQGLMLDPADEIESALITMATYLRTVRDAPPLPVISEKTLKIDTLRRLAPLFSEDICDVLFDVARDIERFEESA